MACRPIYLGKFAEMKTKGDYFVTVIEDTRKQLIIGAGRGCNIVFLRFEKNNFRFFFLFSATLVIEHKFIHDCGLVRDF